MNVFISYAHADVGLAKRVADSLRTAGFQVWLDTTNILPGENRAKILEEAREAREKSDAMVVLLTPEAECNSRIAENVEYALGEKRFKGRLIPVIAGFPEPFAPDYIPWVFDLSLFQKIYIPNLEEAETGLKQIARALQMSAA